MEWENLGTDGTLHQFPAPQVFGQHPQLLRCCSNGLLTFREQRVERSQPPPYSFFIIAINASTLVLLFSCSGRSMPQKLVCFSTACSPTCTSPGPSW